MIVAYNALSVRPTVVDGAATFTLNVLRHLPDVLPEARIVVFARAAEDRIPAAASLDVVRVPSIRGPLGRAAFESLALRRTLVACGAGVLVSPNESLPLGLSCPIVVVAQNLAYHCPAAQPAFTGATVGDRLRTLAQFAYWRRRIHGSYARADVVVAVSEETKRVLMARAGLNPARTVVVHEGADSILMPAPRADAQRDRRILVVSTLAPYKGLHETLDIFARLRANDPNTRLEIVGADWRGFGRLVRARVAALGLEECVSIRGDVPAAELATLYATSRILLFLSRCESFGLPVVEAMRYGLPVVGSNRSSFPEVAGGAAALVDPDDTASAAAAVGRLLADERLRTELADRGRTRAAQLSWRATAAGVADAVRSAYRG